MQSSYAEQFQREMACLEAEWLRWLPPAIGDHPWQLLPAAARVQIGANGLLELSWHSLPERRLGLARFPRFMVDFRFSGLDADQRYTFMKRFDLYMHRGGG